MQNDFAQRLHPDEYRRLSVFYLQFYRLLHGHALHTATADEVKKCRVCSPEAQTKNKKRK